MDLTKELRDIRRKMGKTQKEIAKELDVPQTTWASYEVGKAKPPLKILVKLAEMGYTIPELTTSTVPNGINSLGSAADALEQNRCTESAHVRTKTKDTVVIKQLNGDLCHQWHKIENGSFIIPILEQGLSAGQGKDLPNDDTPTGYIAVPKELKRYGNKLAALYVSGDSMEPTLHRGDLIVCDSCGWDGEGIYALRMNGEGFVKRLSQKPGKILVISDNPKYEAWEENTESTSLEIIGRVHYTLKRTE